MKRVIPYDILKELIALRIRADSLKREAQCISSQVEEQQSLIFSLLNNGYHAPEGFEIMEKISTRKNVAWKSELASIAGADVVAQIYEATEPTIYKSLFIREIAASKKDQVA